MAHYVLDGREVMKSKSYYVCHVRVSVDLNENNMSLCMRKATI